MKKVPTIPAHKTEKDTLMWDFLLEEEYDEYFRNNVSKSLSDYRAGKNPTTFHKQAMHSIRKKVLSSSGMYLSSHEIPHKNPLVELLGIA